MLERSIKCSSCRYKDVPNFSVVWTYSNGLWYAEYPYSLVHLVEIAERLGGSISSAALVEPFAQIASWRSSLEVHFNFLFFWQTKSRGCSIARVYSPRYSYLNSIVWTHPTNSETYPLSCISVCRTRQSTPFVNYSAPCGRYQIKLWSTIWWMTEQTSWLVWFTTAPIFCGVCLRCITRLYGITKAKGNSLGV